jgi:hypothetical protein
VARLARHHRRRRAVAATGAVVALAGCSTTQDEAARLQLNSARIRASEVPTRVTLPGQAVLVARVALIAGGGKTAFIVRVRNAGDAPVSDLPISVGVRAGGKAPVYVNATSQSLYSYFDAHLPVVAAGASVTWIYTTDRHLPAHAKPFAMVGDKPSPPAPVPGRLPVIEASARPLGRPLTASSHGTARASQLAIALHNLSGVPQYQLQVYAFAQRAGHYVAAANLTVTHLGSDASRVLKLGVLGSPDHSRLQVEALPTIFR